MGTITRQLLICLVIGFFICGLHCKTLTYPEPASCENDEECLTGKARCLRRECHCTGSYDYGDGKNDCKNWEKCTTTKTDCPENSHCVWKPGTKDVTCKCNDGYFGRAGKPKCRSSALLTIKNLYAKHPCLSDKNCPKYSFCLDDYYRCACYHEYVGNGEYCFKGRPKECSNDAHCTEKHGKCILGKCRCVGMYVGNGIHCREAKPCEDDWKCGKNQHCLIDRLFPRRPRCDCNDDAFINHYEECVDCFQDSDCKDELQTCIAQECTCKDGLARGNDKKCKPGPLHPCQDDNDCEPSRAKCIKGKCFCQRNSTGNGKYCRDSQPCKGNHNCDGNSKCVVDPLIPDKPHCVCNDGFRKTDVGACVEITECFRLQGRDCPIFGQICSRVPGGSYNCTCPEGYDVITLGGNSACQDVDECSDPRICSANSVCENSKGSYHCKCNEGYAKNGNGVCEDKDECSDKAEACGAHEKCVNKKGGYFCRCEKGYRKKNGACVKGLKSGSPQVSGYLSTFILGVLGSLALSA